MTPGGSWPVPANEKSIAPFRVAITFDVEHPDRPTVPGVTERLLETLEREAVRATLFIQGRWAEAYPRVAAEIGRAGHLIGNHSHYHARLPLLTPDGLASDVAAAAAAITDVTGADPLPWFRCPFGSGQEDPELLAQLNSLGYRNVGWDVDARDWDGGAANDLEERVVRETLVRGDGGIVLMHGWPKRTADALPAIVARLREAGATFVSVAELESPTSGFPVPPRGHVGAGGHTGLNATRR